MAQDRAFINTNLWRETVADDRSTAAAAGRTPDASTIIAVMERSQMRGERRMVVHGHAQDQRWARRRSLRRGVCPLLAHSRHGLLRCTCLLLTQSSHRGLLNSARHTHTIRRFAKHLKYYCG
jgi:hypothetical protein